MDRKTGKDLKIGRLQDLKVSIFAGLIIITGLTTLTSTIWGMARKPPVQPVLSQEQEQKPETGKTQELTETQKGELEVSKTEQSAGKPSMMGSNEPPTARIRELKEEDKERPNLPDMYKRTKAIEFIDEKGKKIKEIEIPEKPKSIKYKNGEIYQEVKYILNSNGKYVTVTNVKEIGLGKELHAFGNSYDVKNTITYYDSQGNILFELKDMPFYPKVISENGERILCVNPVQDEVEGSASPDLYVLSKDGKIIYEMKNTPFSYYMVYISPSGNWIAYKKGDWHLVNIDTKEEIIISDRDISSKLGGISRITDEGEIIREDFYPGDTHVLWRKYNPKTGKVEQQLEGGAK